jgi:hypothetical protein
MKPQTGSPSGTCRRRCCLGEGLEYFVTERDRNTTTFIANGHSNSVRLTFDYDVYHAALVGEFCGICQKVRHHLMKPLWINKACQRSILTIDIKLDPIFVSRIHVDQDRLFDQSRLYRGSRRWTQSKGSPSHPRDVNYKARRTLTQQGRMRKVGIVRGKSAELDYRAMLPRDSCRGQNQKAPTFQGDSANVDVALMCFGRAKARLIKSGFKLLILFIFWLRE